MTKLYKKILFDLDNTLVDDDENRKHAFRKILEEKNGKATEDEVNAFIILDSNFWCDRAAGKIKDPYPFKDNQEKSDWVQSQRFIMFFKEITFEEAKSINRKYIDYLNEHIVPMKNASETLDYLYNRGYELYIITNSPAKVIDNKLTKSGLKKYITGIFTAEEVGHMKPHDDFYKNIYNKIGNDGDMLIVGDELGCDIALGVKNNIDTCWFNNKSHKNVTIYEPTYIIDDLVQLTEIL